MKLKQLPTIKTSDFTMREFREPDAESLFENINDPDVARRVSNIPYPYTLSNAKEWIGLMEKEKEKGYMNRLDFVIDIDGKVAGSIGFINIDGHKAQVSYWLGKKYWSKGIMTEALKKLVQFGFGDMNFKRIYGYTYHPNKASMRVLEKVGFKLEGVHKKEWFRAGEYYDSHVYAIVR